MSLVRVHKASAWGSVPVPPSKSFAHRYVLASFLASLRGESSRVAPIELSEDIAATLEGVRALGGRFQLDGNSLEISPAVAAEARPLLPCRESGSTLRFFIPVASALCGGGHFEGSPRLMARGLDVYEKIFASQGLRFECSHGGLEVEGRLRAGRYRVDGNLSSQFITGLLFALPLLDGDSELEIIPPLKSAPYLDITLEVLAQAGIRIRREGTTFFVPGGQGYRGGCFAVEGDYSNAAFLEMLNRIGGRVDIQGLRPDSRQGDRVLFDLFDRLEQGHATLDVEDCIDLGPALFCLSAVKHGARFVNTRRLRIKESDRVADLCAELAKLGVRSDIADNEVEIYPLSDEAIRRLEGTCPVLDSHNDHRLAMSLGVLATLFTADIAQSGSVAKSYPGFFNDLQALHIPIDKRP